MLLLVEAIEHPLQAAPEMVGGSLIVDLILEVNLAVAIHCHAVAGIGQVFGGEPEIQGVLGNLIHRPLRHQEGFQRRIAFHDRTARFAGHLDIAHRPGVFGVAIVPVVHGDRFWNMVGLGSWESATAALLL